MNETPNTRTAELFDAMVAAYETWAEPLSARLAQVALESHARSTDQISIEHHSFIDRNGSKVAQ